MKFETPQNTAYCATVVKLKNIITLPNCDNVVATTIFGFQAITSKDNEVGTMGIVFTAETQLSDEFCFENGLYRHADKNKDQSKKGYMEDNRRVKAVKFRGHSSNCLFMPLECVKYTGIDITKLKEGDMFDVIDGKEVCKKYVVRLRGMRGNYQPLPKRFTRVDTRFIPEHFSTDNYFRNSDLIRPDQEIIVTQKIHGTSIRIANTIVSRKITFKERIARFLGVLVQPTEYDYVFGSRKVIKDIYNPNHNHFYENDIWGIEGAKLKGLIPENFIVYGELIGYVSTGAPIQSGYTYKIEEKTCQLFIYRVAFVNATGLVVDLTWDQLKEFCDQRGLKYVPEIWRGKHSDFIATNFIDKRLKDEYDTCLPLEDTDTVDEGVCIRVDRLTPYILKAKSPKFLEFETEQMDKEIVDMEEQTELTPESP